MATPSNNITFLAKDSDGRLEGIAGRDIAFALVPSYTVANLPAGIAGAIAFATNCCAFTGATNAGLMTRQTPGNGTGSLVTHDGTGWHIAGTNVNASA
jgi:hypothetical protein